MAGRRRKPNAIREAEGNRGRRPIPDEPKVPAGTTMPSYLSAGARAVWRRLYPLLDESGVLARTDREALIEFCTVFDRWRVAEAEVSEWLEQKNTYLVKQRNGVIKPHPSIAIANTYLDKARQLQADLGLTPTSRSRVSILDAAQPVDELAEFFGATTARAHKDTRPN